MVPQVQVVKLDTETTPDDNAASTTGGKITITALVGVGSSGFSSSGRFLYIGILCRDWEPCGLWQRM